MLFNSLHFFVFYNVVLIAFCATPQRWRWLLLLIASYYSYMWWNPLYALLLVGLTLWCYIAAIGIDVAASRIARRAWLVVGIGGCVGLLLFYKYLDFFSISLSYGLGAVGVHWSAPLLHMIIPVGISFHTFQSMGYLIDVHRRDIRAERHLGIYGVFIVFFPQLLAGPIERSRHMLPQFRRHTPPTYERVSSGLRWALWGLFKKMAIADLLASFVSHVYAKPQGISGAILLLATFFFSIQIYCDFSGYSDVAVGLARIMGYDLMINFRQPYLARSVSEFWSRWHISLSTWFRDYVYIPLGGSRVRPGRWTFNILVVFVLSGLWHGASVLFLLWGLLHAVYLLTERVTQPLRKRLAQASGLGEGSSLGAFLSTAKVFLLVMIGWVLFRAGSVADAAYILRHMFQLRRLPMASFFTYGLPRFEFMLAFVMIALLIAVEFFLRFRPPALNALWQSRAVRWGCYAGCAYAIVFFGVFDRVEFIYFQF